MSVYITKRMLSKFGKLGLPLLKSEDKNSTNNSCENKHNLNLVKDYLCRVCGKNGCTPLMDKLDGGYDIMSAIQTITNVQVNFDDSLPKYICTECLMSLEIAMNFKRTCEETDKKFKNMLNPSANLSSYPYSKHDFTLILHKMKLKRLKIEELQERARQKKEMKQAQKKSKHLKEKQFDCSPCNLSFPTKEELECHRRGRQCNKRRACEVCGELVVNLAHHNRAAHRLHAYQCPHCGKAFPMMARLKAHMLVHTDTFNFFCDLCPYKCKQKYYLVMHMRTHTGEKPYKCFSCSATFVNASNLNKHKLTHSEKQFKCEVCSKCFRTNPSLREHHEAAHMNIKHSCTLCGRDFCYKSDLRKHEIRAHNRTKREYPGGEPAYRAVERRAAERWAPPAPAGPAPPAPAVAPAAAAADHAAIYTAYAVAEGKQEFIYYTEVPMEHVTVQQQTVHIETMPELVAVKKDETHTSYEATQAMGLF